MSSSILESILKKKESSWNEIIFDEDATDFLLQKLKLPVIEDDGAKVKGEYIVDDGVAFVVLKPKLKNPGRRWVVLHEVGHHLLHYPVNHRFSKGTKRRMDREANYFAAVALIPTFLIQKNFANCTTIDTSLRLIAEEYNYPKELVRIRKEIWEAYRI